MSRNTILTLLGAVILCFASFFNKFPLLTTNTGCYINYGFNKDTQINRNHLYGIFVFNSSLGKSLWLVVFIQSLILSLVLYYYFRYFSKNYNFIYFYLAYIIFITFCLSASVTTSTIDIDIFTSVSILCGGLLLFGKNITRLDLTLISIITILSSGMAIPNLFTLALLTIIYSVKLIFNNKSSPVIHIEKILSKILTISLLLTISFFIIYIFGFSKRKDFLGIIGRNSIANKSYTSKLLNDTVRYKRIIEGSLIEPAIQNNAILKSKDNVFLKIKDIPVDEINNKLKHSETLSAIYMWYRSDVREFLLSRQAQGWIEFNYLQYSQIISILIACWIAIILTIKKLGVAHLGLFYFIFIAILLEITIESFLIGIDRHIIYKLIWMLSMPIFLFVSEAEYFKKNI